MSDPQRDLRALRPTGCCPNCRYPINPGTCPECGRFIAEPEDRPRRSWVALRAAAYRSAILFGVSAALWFSAPPLAARLLPAAWLERMAGFEEGFEAHQLSAFNKWALAAYLTRVRAREKGIKAELETLTDHPWAGHYRNATDPRCASFHNVYISPRGDFVYHYGTQNYWLPGLGHIEPIDELSARWYHLSGTPFYSDIVHFVTVGGDTFLIRDGEMMQFCNIWNGCGDFTCAFPTRPRSADYTAATTTSNYSPPRLTPPYDSFLLPHPLAAEVVAVFILAASPAPEHLHGSQEPCHRVEVIVNLGRLAGVWEGMAFHRAQGATCAFSHAEYVLVKARHVGETEAHCVTNLFVLPEELSGLDRCIYPGMYLSTRADGSYLCGLPVDLY